MEPNTFIPEDTSMYLGVIYYLHAGDFVPRYVGQTRQTLKRRFQDHSGEVRRGTEYPIYRWMRKHGDAVQVCVIETFDKDTIQHIDEREIFLIAQHRAIEEKGLLNITDGGSGSFGRRHTEEAKAKMSAAHKGEKAYWYGKTGKAHPAYGRTMSEEARAKISAANSGKNRQPYTPEAISKMSSSGVEGNHIRWHKGRDIKKDGCIFCFPKRESICVEQLWASGRL